MHRKSIENQLIGRRFELTLRILWLLLFLVPVSATAQTTTTATDASVTVGLYESPPFVMPDTGDAPSGMAIDLFSNVSERLELTPNYTFFSTVRELVEAVETGAVDVAVTNMTINQRRAELVDFTQPWYDAGLRIMIHEDAASGLGAVVDGLSSAGHLEAYAWLITVIVVATILLTLFDRRFDKEFHERWRDGIAHSFHSVMSVATSGRPPSRKNLFGWIGKVWSALWLVVGIGVVAYITSSVTSVMTTLAIEDSINGPSDLPGKTIGVSEGSTAEDFARAFGFGVQVYPGVAAAAEALLNGDIDAVVGDAPVLEYYDHINPDLGLDVVGQIFQPEKYGFALQQGSPLTKDITVELLGLMEDGTIDQVNSTYFGSNW